MNFIEATKYRDLCKNIKGVSGGDRSRVANEKRWGFPWHSFKRYNAESTASTIWETHEWQDNVMLCTSAFVNKLLKGKKKRLQISKQKKDRKNRRARKIKREQIIHMTHGGLYMLVKASLNHDTETTEWTTNHIKATWKGLSPPAPSLPTRGPAKRQGYTVILMDMINGGEKGKERGVMGGCLVLLMILEMRLKGKLQTDWIVFAIIAENSLCRAGHK